MKTEFLACFEATNHSLWLCNFIRGLRVLDTISKPLKIYCDNVTIIFLSKNDRYSKAVKHIDMKYLSVKEQVQNKKVAIEHISTSLNITDPLTKGIPPSTFSKHIESTGLVNNI